MVNKLEKVFKALGDKNRLRILKMLQFRPMCVCEIRYVLQLSQPAVSGHLRVLKEAGLVEDKKEGFWVVYRIKKEGWNDKVFSILKELDKDKIVQEDLKLVKTISRQTVR